MSLVTGSQARPKEQTDLLVMLRSVPDTLKVLVTAPGAPTAGHSTLLEGHR
jgi:hypothetical protein